MNCEIAHERIVSAAYGELPDELVHELDRHIVGCIDCHKEREQMLALKVLADAYPSLEPEPNLVARSRMRLEEALDALPPMRWYERASRHLRNGYASLMAAPIAASLLLLLGATAGTLGGFQWAQSRATKAAMELVAKGQADKPATLPVEFAPEEVNISSIVRQPGSGLVEVRYNQVVPQKVQGSVDSPEIRQLLMLASENSPSAAVRDNSVGLMAAECRAGHGCQPAGIRNALEIALRYDKNAGVRQKALQGLAPYVGEDVGVRDAVLEALMNDADARIRTEAINLLEPVEADTSVRQVLNSVANTDQNPHIRTVSRQVLSRVNEIQ